MQIFIIIALLIAVIAVIFALQNTAAVTVTFLFWSINGSLALILLLTLLVGVLISVLVSLPGLIRRKWSLASHKKKLTALEAERSAYQKQAEDAQKEMKELEEQLANLSAALDGQLPNEPTPPA